MPARPKGAAAHRTWCAIALGEFIDTWDREEAVHLDRLVVFHQCGRHGARTLQSRVEGEAQAESREPRVGRLSGEMPLRDEIGEPAERTLREEPRQELVLCASERVVSCGVGGQRASRDANKAASKCTPAPSTSSFISESSRAAPMRGSVRIT